MCKRNQNPFLLKILPTNIIELEEIPDYVVTRDLNGQVLIEKSFFSYYFEKRKSQVSPDLLELEKKQSDLEVTINELQRKSDNQAAELKTGTTELTTLLKSLAAKNYNGLEPRIWTVTQAFLRCKIVAMTTPRKNYTAAFKAQIVQELLKEEQTLAQIASKQGVHPTQLRNWRAAALKAMPDNFDDEERYQKRLAQLTEEHEREKEKLYAEIGKLRVPLGWQLNWQPGIPKKKLRVLVSRPLRLNTVERENSEMALSVQADLLGLSRASLYYQPTGPSEWEVELKHRIDAIYTDYPFYGSRRIQVRLNRAGFRVNRRTVQRYMREMCLKAIALGANLSKRNLQHKVYPYLLREVTASYPNHVWGIDIT